MDREEKTDSRNTYQARNYLVGGREGRNTKEGELKLSFLGKTME